MAQSGTALANRIAKPKAKCLIRFLAARESATAAAIQIGGYNVK
jgi:hypothetical protein